MNKKQKTTLAAFALLTVEYYGQLGHQLPDKASPLTRDFRAAALAFNAAVAAMTDPAEQAIAQEYQAAVVSFYGYYGRRHLAHDRQWQPLAPNSPHAVRLQFAALAFHELIGDVEPS
jgi:hypothetical protein